MTSPAADSPVLKALRTETLSLGGVSSFSHDPAIREMVVFGFDDGGVDMTTQSQASRSADRTPREFAFGPGASNVDAMSVATTTRQP